MCKRPIERSEDAIASSRVIFISFAEETTERLLRFQILAHAHIMTTGDDMIIFEQPCIKTENQSIKHAKLLKNKVVQFLEKCVKLSRDQIYLREKRRGIMT